jgi:hypothetical protein
LAGYQTEAGNRALNAWLSIDREEALRLYTQGSSWFSSEAEKKGSLAPGQLADLVALTDDYFDVPEEQIKGIESVLTVVGGKIVHAREEFASHAPPPLPVLPEWSPVKVFGGYGAPLDVRKAARVGVPVQHRDPGTVGGQPRYDRRPDPGAFSGRRCAWFPRAARRQRRQAGSR